MTHAGSSSNDYFAKTNSQVNQNRSEVSATYGSLHHSLMKAAVGWVYLATQASTTQ